VKLTKSSKGIYQVGTQLPYANPWKAAIAAVHAGEIGKPIFIRAHRHNTGDLAHDHEWYFKRSMSGDTICEQAVHEFDIFNRIFQGIPERAAGFGGQALSGVVGADPVVQLG
jgi:predicted dehydrogenase